MNAKKFFVGSLICSAMLINFSPAFADEDDVEIFGTEFEETETTSAQNTTQQEVDEPFSRENTTPQVEVTEPASQNTSATENTSTEVEVEVEVETDEEIGDELVFDDLSKNRPQTPTVEVTPPAVEVVPPTVEVNPPTIKLEPEIPTDVIEITSSTENNSETKKSSTQSKVTTANSTSKNKKQKKLKMQKARFVKLTMDSNYIYYLDKETVSWKKMPYSTTEMMADVWIRMIERDDDELLEDSEIDDVIFAAEEGKQFRPEDLEVLRHRKYHLEHYYLRPKTQQIQYLVELSDIEGNPQNTVNQRTYSHANWEDLIPNSVEYRIYRGVVKVIGTGRASQDAPVGFADMLEEYARISIR